MRAIGYLTEYGPAGDVGTLAAQNDAFLRYCDANGYQPAAAFLDPLPGDGAGASDRPGLRQLLDYLNAPDKGFIAVVVTAFARLGPERAAAARTYFQISGKRRPDHLDRRGPA